MQWIYSLTGWQLALVFTTFTWALTAAGALVVFFYKSPSNLAITLMTSAAAGIMLASTFFSLLLPAKELSTENPWLVLTCGFALGGLMIIATDLIMRKLKLFSDDDKKRSSAVMCIAVTMHNIPEGMAVGVAFGALASGSGVEAVAAIMLAVGIGIQNFPEGMCVAFPLRANGMSRKKAFFYGQLSGAVEILAGVIGALCVTVVGGILPWALAFSAGAMVAVVCSELIPESFSGDKIIATLGVLSGFTLMMLLDVAFG